LRPADYAQDVGWAGHDVWHAHCVKLDEAGMDLFARTGTGVAHCPCSNMRIGSGIAPISRMVAKKIKVGIGVDGSASNDGAHMLGEVRQALLLQRVGLGPAAMTARTALELGTLGGAAVLGRDDIGSLAPGMAADFAAFDLRGINHSGGHSDPVAALVFCTPSTPSWVAINGRVVVENGQLTAIDLPTVIGRHNALSKKLTSG
jgi:cytosine/adenosine deaminase-related metal-dependent hydrolase